MATKAYHTTFKFCIDIVRESIIPGDQKQRTIYLCAYYKIIFEPWDRILTYRSTSGLMILSLLGGTPLGLAGVGST
jgi:hypothetical protein